jgi:putative hydrolase of the HAD superfamily
MEPDVPAVHAVTLDVGGVLTLPPILDVLARHGVVVTASELLVAHHRGVAIEDALLAAAPGAPDAVGSARRALFDTVAEMLVEGSAGRAAVVEALADIGVSGAPWSVVVPGALEVVDRLKGAGLRVAIVSNSDGTVATQLDALGICHEGGAAAGRVAAVVDSGAVGVRKPDPKIFDFALDALGTPAGVTAHVGDTVAFDVQAALAAGLVPVHFDATGTCRGEHRHIARLEDLPTLLRPDA